MVLFPRWSEGGHKWTLIRHIKLTSAVAVGIAKILVAKVGRAPVVKMAAKATMVVKATSATHPAPSLGPPK